MLENDAGQKGVPERSDRIVVAAVPAPRFQFTHQRFVGKMIEQ